MSGDATMKATIGAHGALLASMLRTTAIVPHEQKGVSVASSTPAPTAIQVRLRSQPDRRSVPMYTETAAAARMPISR